MERVVQQKRGRYSAEFKEMAVREVVESSRSIADVARKLGVVEQTLGNWVIDIDASKNPNIGKGAGLDAVAAVTGKNPRATTTAGLSADKVQSAAEDLRIVSRDYVAAMASDTAITPVLLRLANEGRTAAKLPALTSGALRSGPAHRGQSEQGESGDGN